MIASRASSTHCETQQAGAVQLAVMAVLSAVPTQLPWVSGTNDHDNDEKGLDAPFPMCAALGMAATVLVSVICVLLL